MLRPLNEVIDETGEVKENKRTTANQEAFVWRSFRLARRQTLSAITALKTAEEAGRTVPLLLALRQRTPVCKFL